MSAITPTAATPGTPALPGQGGSRLDQAAFLRLMTAQVAAQDPFKPLDQTQMLAQLAQFSQVAGTAEMNVSLGALLDAVQQQGAMLADIRAALTDPANPTTPAQGS